MSKKQSSGWKEGTNNIDTTVRLKDGDKRRDKRNCLNYNRDNKNATIVMENVSAHLIVQSIERMKVKRKRKKL